MANYQKNGVQVVGLRKVVRQIEKLGVEAEDLKAAFRRIGARALSTANAGTPVFSGSLKSTNKQSKRKNSVYLYSGNKKNFYARFVHYGTVKMEARPYLYEAVEKDGPWAVKQLESEMDRLITRLGLSG